FEQRLLLRAERLVRLGWRHDVVWVGRVDTTPQFALFQLARHDRRLMFGGAFEHAVLSIEAQSSFALVRIGPVASEAISRKNGADIPIEVDDRRGAFGGPAQQ